MAYVEIRNKKGTGNNPPPAGYASWLDFWETKQGRKATECEVLSCSSGPNVGGHVFKVGQGPKEYIIPMCYSCNNKPEYEIFKAWDTYLVPVN